MTKRTKSASDESPPLVMKLEGLHLVPASAWDQERLASYSGRSVLYVQIVAPQSAQRIRFEAILNTVMKKCQTPWTNVATARVAIKKALGVVDVKTVKGEMKLVEASLTTLTEDEFRDFYERAMLLLQEITGVDPETLTKESAPVYQSHETPSASQAQKPADGAGDAASPQLPASPDPSAAADPSADEGTGPASPSSAGFDRDLGMECIRKFLGAATDKTLPDPLQRQYTLKSAGESWRGILPDDFVRTCLRASNDIILGKHSVADARRVMEAMLP